MSKLLLKCNLLILWLAVIAITPAFAQNMQTVTGVVKDKNGAPIPSASVNIVGSSRATMTNEQGVFRIEAKVGESIQVSSINFEPKTVKVTSAVLEIIMDEAVNNTLGEVVAVAYGTATKKNLTTAQSTIKTEDIQKTVNTTFDQAIQGRVAGVNVTSNSGQPGGGSTITIRGVSSITGGTQPLYVIDGEQMVVNDPGFGTTSSVNPLSALNPSDIESMEVLQGPSATAMYGSRATNGVVLITTKKGKAGETKIGYEMMYSLQDKPDQLRMLNLREYAMMNNQLRRQAGEKIPPAQQDSTLLGEGSNWQDAIFRRAPFVRHQLNLSGGVDKIRYYISGEHANQQGTAVGSGFKRNGFRSNVESNLKRWLKVGLNIAGSQTDEQLSTIQNSIIKSALGIAPYVPIKNGDGSYGSYSNEESAYTDVNPLARAELINYSVKKRKLTGGLNIGITLLKGLEFRSLLNGAFGADYNTFFTPTYKIGTKTNDAASLQRTSNESQYWSWNQILEYKKAFGRHNITFLGGHEASETKWDGISAARIGFPFNEMAGGQVPSIILGGTTGQTTGGWKGWNSLESYFARVNYNYANKYLLELSGRRDGSSFFGPLNKWGNYPAGSVAWRVSQEEFMKKQDIISDLKLRFEMGATGNPGYEPIYYGPLNPIASPFGSSFMSGKYANPVAKWESTITKNFGFNIAFLKNRISLDGDIYVRNTNDLLMENPLPMYMGTNPGSGSILPPTVNIAVLKNTGWSLTLNTVNVNQKDFKWNTNFNISHVKTHLSKLTNTTDFITMDNWGAPGFLQMSKVGNVPWQFWGYQADGIFQSIDDLNKYPRPEDGTTGNPLGIAYNKVWVGDYRYKDLDGNGIINTNDQTFIGNPYPKFTFGFTNTFTWKGFDLMVLMTGSYGNQIYNALRQTLSNPGLAYTYRNTFKSTMDGYARLEYASTDLPGQPSILANPDATVARWQGSNGNFTRSSSLYVEDGSYLKFKNITLSYRLPSSVLRQSRFIEGMKLAFGVQNAYTFTKYTGYDPEIGTDVGYGSDRRRRTFGVDVGQYPPSRIYTFNLNVNF